MAVLRFNALRSQCCASIFTLLLSCFSTGSLAAEGADAALDETDLFIEIPQINSATRLSQKRSEAPASITVIDRAMIRASGAQEIADLFRLVPGFQAYQVNGHKFGVTAHDIGDMHPGRLEVMIDGRSVYLPALSSVDWRSLGISLNDIDHIEVVRGSNVPAYGSNAFLGAINIITYNAFNAPNSAITAGLGSQDSGRVEFNHSDSFGNHGMRLSGGYQQHEGFGIGDEGQGRYLNLRTTSTPTLSDTLDLQLGFSQGEAGIGAVFLPILERRYTAHYQTLTWTRDLNSSDNLRIQLYHNYFKAEMEHIPLSSVFGPLLEILNLDDELFNPNLEEGKTERYDLELQHQLRLNADLRAVWGVGIRQDKGESSALFNTQSTLTENLWRGFGNLEWAPSQSWIWNLGAMTEHLDSIGTKTSTRAGVNYSLDANHHLRLSYTRAFRMPSLLDSQQDARWTHSSGTPLALLLDAERDLDPEKNRTLELGYLGAIPALHLDVDLKLFHEEVSQGLGRKITPEAPPYNLFDTLTSSNHAQWHSWGLETQLKFRPSANFWLALQYGYLDLEGTALDGAAPSVDKDLSTLAPNHSFSLIASRTFSAGLEASITAYKQSKTSFINGSEVQSYQRLDTRLAKTYRAGTTEAQIALVIQNLLDDEYAEFQDRNIFDRRVYLSLSLRH